MYRILDRGFNVATLHIANQLTGGFRVSEDAPKSYEELMERTAREGIITVHPGHSLDTIYGDPEVNYSARAWHDWCHVVGRHDFSVEGEVACCRMQQDHIYQ